MNPEWIKQGHNDFTAIVGNDMLRVEQMGTGVWWWAIYAEGWPEIAAGNGYGFPYQKNEMDAKLLAEAVYRLIKNT